MPVQSVSLSMLDIHVIGTGRFHMGILPCLDDDGRVRPGMSEHTFKMCVGSMGRRLIPVSYTQLTLPTIA